MKVYEWKQKISELSPTERKKLADSILNLISWETFRNEYPHMKTILHLLRSD